MFEFWRFLRIPEERFLKTADIGDIILCLPKKKYKFNDRLNKIEQICVIVKLDDEQDAFSKVEK